MAEVMEPVLAFIDTAFGHGCCRFGNNQSQLTRLGMQNTSVPSFGERTESESPYVSKAKNQRMMKICLCEVR